MRRIVLLSLLVLLVRDAGAQRRGGFAPGFGRVGFPLSRGRGVFPYGLGYGYWPYDAGAAYDPSYPPIMVVQPPPPPPPAVESTPREVRPVVRDYKWPAASAAIPSDEHLQPFGIVLKDGSTLVATTVVASDDVLHYVDPDERHLRISMKDVDRAATLRLNRERKLNLYLPAAPQ